MSTPSKFIVEMWPGQQVEIDPKDLIVPDERHAFIEAVLQNGWLGGFESSGGKSQFKAWVTRVE